METERRIRQLLGEDAFEQEEQQQGDDDDEAANRRIIALQMSLQAVIAAYRDLENRK
jgi:hypothetical protein